MNIKAYYNLNYIDRNILCSLTQNTHKSQLIQLNLSSISFTVWELSVRIL